ncbi:MAG: hypothetical protein M1812_003931 [Candelaria pacifica]|nr:MAG: hypothetical protein M1812_003931 [Candelaria pacifica]
MVGAPTSAQLQLTAMPGEILNKIYAYVFTQDVSLNLWARGTSLGLCESTMACLQSSSKLARPNFGFGLFRANRKFYNECTVTFYSSTRFDFSQPGGWEGLLLFLKTIGKKYRAHLQRVAVFIPLPKGGFEPLHLCCPDSGEHRWGTPILENKDLTVLECFILLNNDSTLRELFFIIPAGISVGDAQTHGLSTYKDNVPRNAKGVQIYRKAERIIVEVQEDGQFGLDERWLDSLMKRFGWELVRKPGSFRFLRLVEENGEVVLCSARVKPGKLLV